MLLIILIVGKLISTHTFVVGQLDAKTEELVSLQTEEGIAIAKGKDDVLKEIRKQLGKLNAIISYLKQFKDFLEKAIKDFFESMKGIFEIGFGR